MLLLPGKKKEERLKKQAEEIKRANAPRMARGGLDPITLDLIDQRNKKRKMITRRNMTLIAPHRPRLT